MDKQWHIFRVSPGKEAKVGSALVAVDPGSVYVPQRNVRRYNRRQRVSITRAEVLFPGYVFVETADPHRLLSIPCDALLGAVRTPSKDLAVLPLFHLYKLYEAEARAQQMADEKPVPVSRHKRGDKVKPIDLIEAIVTDVTTEKVTMETKMFGAMRTIVTDVSKLERTAA